MTSIYDLDRAGLATALGNGPRYRVDQAWSGLYEHFRDPAEISTLPRPAREALLTTHPTSLTPVAERVSDDGNTLKMVTQIAGGYLLETVLMLYPDRATVCVSSQAGCAMACGFCATGQAGFDRQLTAGEIIEQVVRAARRAKSMDRRVSNVVFMGMGEPMANYDAVWRSVERMHGDIGISARHLTISTVGLIPGIRRLTAEQLPVNLAVSLHAANDELRDRLAPINKRYPLAELMDACDAYLAARNRRLSFEWALIAGVNDRPGDARELAALCRARPLPAHVNLIPLNPTGGFSTPGTPTVGVRAFRDRLVELGVNATIRRNRGNEIDAACGQLAGATRVQLRSKA